MTDVAALQPNGSAHDHEIFDLMLSEVIYGTRAYWQLAGTAGRPEHRFMTDLRINRTLSDALQYGFAGLLGDEREEVIQQTATSVLGPVVDHVRTTGAVGWRLRMIVTELNGALLNLPLREAAKSVGLDSTHLWYSLGPAGGPPDMRPLAISSAIGVYASPSGAESLDIRRELNRHQAIFYRARVPFTPIMYESRPDNFVAQLARSSDSVLLHVSAHGVGDGLVFIGGEGRDQGGLAVSELASALKPNPVALAFVAACSSFSTSDQSRNPELDSIRDRWRALRQERTRVSRLACVELTTTGAVAVGFDQPIPDAYAIAMSSALYELLVIDGESPAMALEDAASIASAGYSADGMPRVIAIFPAHIDPHARCIARRTGFSAPPKIRSYLSDNGALPAVAAAVRLGVKRVALLGAPHIGKSALVDELVLQLEAEGLDSVRDVVRTARRQDMLDGWTPELVVHHNGYRDNLLIDEIEHFPRLALIAQTPAAPSLIDFCPPIPAVALAFEASEETQTALLKGRLRTSEQWEPGVRVKQLLRFAARHDPSLHHMLWEIIGWVRSQLRSASDSEIDLLALYVVTQNPWAVDVGWPNEDPAGPAGLSRAHLLELGLLQRRSSNGYQCPPSLQELICLCLPQQTVTAAHAQSAWLQAQLGSVYEEGGDQQSAAVLRLAASHHAVLARDWSLLHELLGQGLHGAHVAAFRRKIALAQRLGAPSELLDEMSGLADSGGRPPPTQIGGGSESERQSAFDAANRTLSEGGTPEDVLRACTVLTSRPRHSMDASEREATCRLFLEVASEMEPSPERLLLLTGSAFTISNWLDRRGGRDLLALAVRWQELLPPDEFARCSILLMSGRVAMDSEDLAGAAARFHAAAAFVLGTPNAGEMALDLALYWSYYFVSLENSAERAAIFLAACALLGAPRNGDAFFLASRQDIMPNLVPRDTQALIDLTERVLGVPLDPAVRQRIADSEDLLHDCRNSPEPDHSGVLANELEILDRAYAGDPVAIFVVDSAVRYLTEHPRRLGHALSDWRDRNVNSLGDSIPRIDPDEPLSPILFATLSSDETNIAKLIAMAAKGDPFAQLVGGAAVMVSHLSDCTREQFREGFALLNVGALPSIDTFTWEHALVFATAVDLARLDTQPLPDISWLNDAVIAASDSVRVYLPAARHAATTGCSVMVALWRFYLEAGPSIESQPWPDWTTFLSDEASTSLKGLLNEFRASYDDGALLVNLATAAAELASDPQWQPLVGSLVGMASLTVAGDDLIRAANIYMQRGAFSGLRRLLECVPQDRWGVDESRVVLAYYLGFARLATGEEAGAVSAWEIALDSANPKLLGLGFGMILRSLRSNQQDRDLMMHFLGRLADTDGIDETTMDGDELAGFAAYARKDGDEALARAIESKTACG